MFSLDSLQSGSSNTSSPVFILACSTFISIFEFAGITTGFIVRAYPVFVYKLHSLTSF